MHACVLPIESAVRENSILWCSVRLVSALARQCAAVSLLIVTTALNMRVFLHL